MTKIEKLARAINDGFSELLDTATNERHPGIEARTEFSLLEMNRRTTFKTRSKKKRAEVLEYVAGYSDGYLAALTQVRKGPEA